MSRFPLPAAPEAAPILNLPPAWSPRLTAAEQDKRLADEQPQGLFPSMVDSAYADWSVSWVGRMLARAGTNIAVDPQPGFTVTDDMVKRLGEGIPENQWHKFWGTQSYDEATQVRDQLIDVNNARHRIATGTSPILAPLATGLLDPGYIAASIATGGAAAPLKAAMGGSRLAGLASRGIVDVGLTMAPVEAYRSDQDPDAGFTDSMVHGALGLAGIHIATSGLGKGIGYLKGLREGQKAVELRDTVTAAQTGKFNAAMGASGAGEFTPEMQAILSKMRITDAAREMVKRGLIKNPDYFAEQIGHASDAAYTTTPEVRHIEAMIDAAGLDPVHHAEDIAIIREHAADLYDLQFREGTGVPPSTAVPTGEVSPEGFDPAAALFEPKKPKPQDTSGVGDQPPPEKPRRQRLGDFFPVVTDAMSARGKLGTIVGRIGRSPSKKFRETINVLLSDPLGKVSTADGHIVPQGEALDDWTKRVIADKQSAFLHQYENGFEQWFREERFPAAERRLRQEQFNTLLVHTIQNDAGKFTDNAHLNDVANATRKLLNDHLDFMHDHYVPGVENIQTDGKYYPNKFKPHLIEAAAAKYGDKEVHRLFAESLLDEPGARLDPDKRSFLGEMYVEAAREGDRIDIERAGGPTENTLAVMEKKLRKRGFTDAQVKDLLYEARGKDIKNGPDFIQRRMNLDRNYSADLKNLETGGLETVRVADFIDQDFKSVIGHYLDRTTRLAGRSKMLKEIGKAHGFDAGYISFDDLRAALIRDAEDAGVAKNTVLEHDKLLTLAHDRVMGRAIEPTTPLWQVLSTIRAYSHTVYSGMFGVAQVPDFGKAVATGGLKSFIRNMPALPRMIQEFRAGKATDADLRVIDRMIAADSESLHRSFIQRLDDSATALDKVERGAKTAAQIASDLGGLGPINVFNRRAAALFGLDRITDISLSGKMPNEARLAQWGLDRATMEQIGAAIRDDKLSHWIEGESRRRVRVPDLASWDPRLAGKFVNAISRIARQSGDEFSLGSSAGWMNTNLGKTMMQFRTFHFQSWEKRLLASVQARDWEAFSGMAYSTLLGALTYMAQMYARSFTVPKDQRQAFRDEKLSLESIGAAAFARNGVSSLLPAAYDNISHLTGGKPLFSDSRYSGLRNEFAVWEANPTTDMVHNVITAGNKIGGPIRDTLFPEGTRAGKLLGSGTSNDNMDQSAARAFFKLMPLRRHIVAQQLYDGITNSFPEHER